MTNVKVHNNTFTGWSTSCADFTDEIGGNTGNPQVYDSDCVVGNASVAGAGGLRPPFNTSGYCQGAFSVTAGTYAIEPFFGAAVLATNACASAVAGASNMRSSVAAPLGVCTIAVNAGTAATNSVTVTFNDVTKSTSGTATIASTNANNSPYTPVTLAGGIAIGDAYNITVTVGATDAFATPRVDAHCW